MTKPDPAAPPAPTGAEECVGVGELRRFLELGAAQLDAAMRESDARVERLSAAVGTVSELARQLQGEVQELESTESARLPEKHVRIRELTDTLSVQVHGAITALQFYDKLIQRLTHVRDGLAIPSDSAQAGASHLQALLEQVRARYSMVEERVLFDFMMRGLSAEQMLKALSGLRTAAAPGELELF